MFIIGQKEIKPRKEKYYKFTCNNCGCIFVAEKEEIYNAWFFDDIWREVVCPKCKEKKIFNYLLFRRYKGEPKNENI